MSHTTRVLTSLLAGALIGLALAFFDTEWARRAAAFFQPIGRLWLNALQMTVVPLVVALVILGVNTANNAAASGRTARTAIVVFLVLLTLGAIFTAFAAPAFLSFLPRDPALAESFRTALDSPAAQAAPPALGDWFAAIIPSNAIAAAAASAMLPLVVFAMFFGFALTRIEPERRARLLELVQGLADTLIVIVRWVLWAAPLGVFALVLTVCAQVGAGVLGALGGYIAMQCLLYLSVTLMLYLVARFVGGEPFRRFATAIAPAQAIAASTQSSLASLPAMVESARVRLGYPPATVSLVLPMAVSLFRITSPMQYLGVAAFVAWTYGIDLTPLQWISGVGLAVAISLGSVGLPIEPLGVLLAIDTIPDVFSTVGNVTADLTATSVVSKRELSQP